MENVQSQVLSVQHFLFQNREFKIYGTNENPLFLVNDIICGLLGMDRPTDNSFFRDHKRDSQYVNCGQFAHSPKELQDRLKKSNQDHIYFFTEKGFYKCIMKSNKPIAEQFQDEIWKLLQNIRLGVIGLQILNEQQLKQQLEDKEKENSSLKKYIEECKEDFVIYEHRIVETDEAYRGITRNLKMRNQSHRNRSCNPFLREAMEQHKEIQTTIIKRFRSLSRDEQRLIEREAILAIPDDKRLNITLPCVKNQTNTLKSGVMQQKAKKAQHPKEERKKIVKKQQIIDDDLSVIMEEKQKRILDDVWMARYNELMEFVKKNRFLPSNKNESDRDQVLKAKWCYRQKKHFQFLDKRYQVLMYAIPGFSEEVKELDIKPFELRLKDLQEVYAQHGKITENVTTATLRCFYGRLLKNFNNDTLIPHHRQLAIDSNLPLTIPKTPAQQWEERYQQCLQYYITNKKLPVFKKDNPNDLGKWLTRQRSDNKDKLTDEQKEKLSKLGITGKCFLSTDEYELVFKEFFSVNQRMPKFNIESERKLYKWQNRHKDIVQHILADLAKEEHLEL